MPDRVDARAPRNGQESTAGEVDSSETEAPSMWVEYMRLMDQNFHFLLIFSLMKHPDHRSQCKTSQGVRREFHRLPCKPDTAFTGNGSRSELTRPETPGYRIPTASKDVKKMLFEVCNDIGSVFPKEKYQFKSMELDMRGVKSEGIRVAFFEFQYLLVKKGFYEDDIRDLLVKLVQRVSRELSKGVDMGNAMEYLRTENMNLKSTIPRDTQEENSHPLQSRRVIKTANRQENRVVMENNKLERLNKSLVKAIEKFKESESRTPKLMEGDQNIIHEWKVEDYKNKISYLQLKLTTEERVNNDLLGKIETYELSAKQTIQQAAGLQEVNSKLKEEKAEWMQRALMQLQDGRTNCRQTKPKPLAYLSPFKRQESKRHEMRKKSELEIKCPVQRKLLFEYQVDFFKSIRSCYYENKAACFKMNLAWKADDLGLDYEKVDRVPEEDEEAGSTPLSQLSFYKPSFYSFVEHIHQKDHSNSELSRSLIQKMRCIMQSKLNEFLLFEDVAKYTRFPEFVYAWFRKYYFDSDKNCIAESLYEEESGYESFKFYKDLVNVKLDQTWEVVTFREFLLEELSLEDLYFYLQCQNMLYRKGGITEDIQYLGQFLVLVKYSVAKSVLEVILSEFQYWNVEFLIAKLGEKVVLVKSQEFIEAAFFLRCLLEYYKLERLNRYKYIRKVACQMKKNYKFPSLNYIECMKVLSNFPDISEANKLAVYRDCYSVGRGMITPEIIFTVCTESRIFLKHLKLKSIYKLPIQTNKNYEHGSLFCLQPPHPYLYEIFSKMKGLLKEGSPFSRKVMRLGVEDLSRRVEYFRRYFLHWKTFSDNSILRCRHFLHFVKQCLGLVSLVNYHQLYELIGDERKCQNKVSLNLDENQIGEIYMQDTQKAVEMVEKTVGLLEWKSKIQRVRENTSARKIQRMIRQKFIEPYVEIYNVMFDKVKKIKYMGSN